MSSDGKYKKIFDKSAAPKIVDGLSNRQRFKLITPSKEVFDKIDSLGLYKVSNKRYELSRVIGKREKKDLYIKFPVLQFFAGAKNIDSIPAPSLPEIAVIGRSNVGKSSFINAVTNTRTVKVDDKPGLTKQLNFYTAQKYFHFVDMPGYGFAYVSEETKKDWAILIKHYIENRKTLRNIYVIIDARHGLKANDHEFLRKLKESNSRFRIVITKCDLVSRSVLARRYDLVKEEIEKHYSDLCRKPPHFFSALNKAGVNDIRREILHTMNLNIEKLKASEITQLKTEHKTNKKARITFENKKDSFKHNQVLSLDMLKENNIYDNIDR